MLRGLSLAFLPAGRQARSSFSAFIDTQVTIIWRVDRSLVNAGTSWCVWIDCRRSGYFVLFVNPLLMPIEVGRGEIDLSLQKLRIHNIVDVQRCWSLVGVDSEHPCRARNKLLEDASLFAMILQLLETLDDSGLQQNFAPVVTIPVGWGLMAVGLYTQKTVEIEYTQVRITESKRPKKDLEEDATQRPDIVWA